jgi:xylitol oxidase
MEWVDARGELRREDVTGPNAPPWAGGLPVSLGSFGIVTRLWLRTVPAYAVAQVVYEQVALDKLVASLPDVLAGADSVSVFTRWREDEGSRIWCKRRLASDGQVGPDSAGPPWWAHTAADGPRHPVPGIAPDRCTPQGGLAGRWHERLPHFRPTATPSMGSELQSEYFVGREDATAAGALLCGLARDRSSAFFRALAVSEVRSVAGDRCWLSPAFERDSVAFHFTWLDEPDTVARAIEAIEELLAPFDPRPHWGKLFGASPTSLWSRLPRLGEAAELGRRLDPAGLFSNDFSRALLRG